MLDYLEEDKEDTSPLRKKPTMVDAVKKYKATSNDDIDQAMAKIINTNGIRLPIIRMGGGKYLIGTDSRMVMIKNTTCVVRVGGGFENLEDFISRNEEFELNKIKTIMEQEQKEYEEVIKDLLNKYKADALIVNQFIKTM